MHGSGGVWDVWVASAQGNILKDGEVDMWACGVCVEQPGHRVVCSAVQ